MSTEHTKQMIDTAIGTILAHGEPYCSSSVEVIFKAPLPVEVSYTPRKRLAYGMYCRKDRAFSEDCGIVVECMSMDRCSDSNFTMDEIDPKFHDGLMESLAEAVGAKKDI